MELICPVCARELQRLNGGYGCANGHRFDLARQGYVNLLMVQQKHSLHPGDTRQQVLSRREFLQTQTYAPIVEAVKSAALAHGASGPVLDVGCGEGYYATQVADALKAELMGLDISKEAVRWAAARYKGPIWICGTASHLPVADESVGLVMSMFALTVPAEFKRVLRKDGIFIQVLAAQDHLLGLKSIIYPQLHLKEKDSVPEIEGFRLVESIPVSFAFTVRDEQVQNLLSMTPHFFRISADGANRLAETKELHDRASCVVNVYKLV